MTRLAKTEKFWNRMSGNFDRRRRIKSRKINPLYEESLKHLHKEDHVLDYGCGTGESSLYFSKHVKSVHGIDISSGMLAIANRKSLREHLGNISFEQLTIFDKELKEKSYNALTAFHILHLVEDTPKVLKQINNLLDEDGIFISSTVCLAEHKYMKTVFKIASKIMGLPYLKNFRVDELKREIETAGFSIIKSDIRKESSTTLFLVAKKNSK